MAEALTWHLLTPEYPPQVGGVADYTANVAESLALSAQEVHVWTRSPVQFCECQRGVIVHGLGPRLGWSALSTLGDALRQTTACHRLLVQYVPHGYGYKGMNVLLASWLLQQRWLGRTRIDVMFHEVAFPWVRHPLRHNLIAAINRLMAFGVARSAERIFVSIPKWSELLQGLANPRTPRIWNPVPAAYVGGDRPTPQREPGLFGHFGTYGRPIVPLLEPVINDLLQDPTVRVLLVGMNSDRFLSAHPQWEGRVTATGELPLPAIVRQLQRCQAILLPFPDGISSRRTSAMLALANGVPILTNRGPLTEPIWSSVPLILADSAILLGTIALDWHNRPEELDQLSRDGQRFYQDHFALNKTIQRLRRGGPFAGDNF